MRDGMKIVVGPHSLGLTLQIAEDVVVYVGLPPPAGAQLMSSAELERQARVSAARALKIALEECESAAE